MRPDEDWEIDHAEPWRITHRTNIYELQAVHKKCNRGKGGKVDFEARNWNLLRAGQQRAIDGIEMRVLNENTTSIVLPCRYGKSDVMRVAAIKLWAMSSVCTTLVLSPAANLRDQMGALWRWNLALKRYGIRTRMPMRIATIDKPKAGDRCRFNANGEMFLSATIQLVQQNLDLFAEWTADEFRRTGRRVLVFIDECHSQSTANEWGKIVPALVNAGAHVVLLTATPVRADKYRIPGFRFEETDRKDITRWRSRPHENDPEHKITVEKLEGEEAVLHLVPDVPEVTFRDAWDEVAPDGGPILCKISWIPFDVEISLTGTAPSSEDPKMWLCDIKDAATVRRYLGRVSRQGGTIRKGVDCLITDMRTRRAFHRNFQGLVYGGSDLDDGDEHSQNKHLEAIRKEILRQWPKEWGTPKVLIATTADGSDGGKDLIRDFAGRDDRPGDGDILLLKQMAGMGTDFPWVKTVLDLSPTRTYAALAQRWLRGATPCAGGTVCGLITLNEIVSHLYFNYLVTEQGGEAKVRDLTVTDTYDKDRTPGTDDPLATVTDTRDGGFADSDGRTAPAEMLDPVAEFFKQFPKAASVYAHAEVAELLGHQATSDNIPETEGAEEREDGFTVRDTSAEATDIKREINNLHQQRAVPRYLRICKERGTDMTFGRAAEYIFGQAKREADWPMGVELDKSNNLVDLARLRDAMKAMCARVWFEE